MAEAADQIAAAIQENLAKSHYGEQLAARGVTTVALNDAGQIVEHRPDGTNAVLEGREPLETTTSSVVVERAGPAIRAVLAEHAPERCAEFESEFRIALAETDDDFDLSRVEAVVDKWWPIAYLTLNPLTEDERAAVARVQAGDLTGFWTKDDGGNWTRL